MTTLEQALTIKNATHPISIQKEKDSVMPEHEPEPENNKNFFYPTIIILPIVIVIISLFALKISLLTKFVLCILLIVSVIFFVLYFKKYDIVEPINNFAQKFNLGQKEQSTSINFGA